MNEHYAAVLEDLKSRRIPITTEIESLSKKLSEIDLLISGINNMSVDVPSSDTISLLDPFPSPSMPYVLMSMRWAILYMLVEHTDTALTSAEIGSRLIKGGFNESSNFNSKVSAILSQMLVRTEVEKAEMGWVSSKHGEDVWKNIKIGDKFKNRHLNGELNLE
jgi:hypothetical protein